MRDEAKIAIAVLAACAIVFAGVIIHFGPSDDRHTGERIGIIGAMEEEVSLIASHMDHKSAIEMAGDTYYSGYIDGKEVVIVESGIGKVNAQMSAIILMDHFKVDLIVNTGVAGGLDPDRDVFDIVVTTSAIQHDFDFTPLGYERGEIPGTGKVFTTDKELSGILYDCANHHRLLDTEVVYGQCLTGDQFIDTLEDRQRLMKMFPGCSMCEMEGAAIGQACNDFEIPFAEIRVISDTEGGEEYEEFEHKAAMLCAHIVIEFIKTYHQ